MDRTEQVTAFCAAITAMLAEHYRKHFPTSPRAPTVEPMFGKRYARLVLVSHNERSAFGFVDLTTGDVLKADGWRGPAKGVRTRLDDSDRMRRVSVFGGVS
jgi:hypothetical protein